MANSECKPGCLWWRLMCEESSPALFPGLGEFCITDKHSTQGTLDSESQLGTNLAPLPTREAQKPSSSSMIGRNTLSHFTVFGLTVSFYSSMTTFEPSTEVSPEISGAPLPASVSLACLEE